MVQGLLSQAAAALHPRHNQAVHGQGRRDGVRRDGARGRRAQPAAQPERAADGRRRAVLQPLPQHRDGLRGPGQGQDTPRRHGQRRGPAGARGRGRGARGGAAVPAEARGRLVGGHRGPEGQPAAVDQAADPAAEGHGEAGLFGAGAGPAQLHAVLHERCLLGLRSGVQVRHQCRGVHVGRELRLRVGLRRGKRSVRFR